MMTLYDMQRLADLHYECYNVALGLSLIQKGWPTTRELIEREKERYENAQREIVKITNKYGSEGFGELEGITNTGLVAA
jgi:hypothetical protein